MQGRIDSIQVSIEAVVYFTYWYKINLEVFNCILSMVFPIQFSPFSQNWNRNAEWKTDLLIYFGTIFCKKQTPAARSH